MPKGCPVPIAELIEACWHSDPDQRPTFEAVVKRLEDMSAQYKADPEAFLAVVTGSGRSIGPSPSGGGSEKGGSLRGGALGAKKKKGGGGFLCCFGGSN